MTRGPLTASGQAHDETRWPLPPMVAPRGYREVLWHLRLAALTIGVLLIHGGWYALLCYALVLKVVAITPRQLQQMATLSAGLACALLTLTGGPSSYARHLGQLLSNQLPHEPMMLTGLMTWSLLIQPLALLVLASWLSFDTRTVTRGVADERVYQRQVQRRTQALRDAHRTRATPTVLRR